jgi:hypothetical protein
VRQRDAVAHDDDLLGGDAPLQELGSRRVGHHDDAGCPTIAGFLEGTRQPHEQRVPQHPELDRLVRPEVAHLEHQRHAKHAGEQQAGQADEQRWRGADHHVGRETFAHRH